MRGLVADNSDENPHSRKPWLHKLAAGLHEFNQFVVTDDRIEALILPLFDGLGLYRLKV